MFLDIYRYCNISVTKWLKRHSNWITMHHVNFNFRSVLIKINFIPLKFWSTGKKKKDKFHSKMFTLYNFVFCLFTSCTHEFYLAYIWLCYTFLTNKNAQCIFRRLFNEEKKPAYKPKKKKKKKFFSLRIVLRFTPLWH